MHGIQTGQRRVSAFDNHTESAGFGTCFSTVSGYRLATDYPPRRLICLAARLP
jgi:hypothetical protein